MNPLLALFGLDIGLLVLAYLTGSVLGLAVVMALCFAVGLGLILFSTAPPTADEFQDDEDDMRAGLRPFFSSFAALER